MNDDLKFHLRSLTRFIYYVTEEEDRFLVKLRKMLAKFEDHVFVYNVALGLVPIKNLFDDWKKRSHKEDTSTMPINEALVKIYKDDPLDKQNFYVITDPERWLAEPMVVRRILNVAHQLRSDPKNVKVMIFVGPRLKIPKKLQRYIEVVQDKGLDDEELTELVTNISALVKSPPPQDIPKVFGGLTSYEVDGAIAQAVMAYRRDRLPDGPERLIDPRYIQEFKRKQLKKTDLVSFVDVSQSSFDDVGGAARFKAWALKTKASWTDDGQKFGLRPPKGVLLLGAWGCGKSISVKALGAAWNLPIVQVELGKLRQSGVGDSEANVYRVIDMIEAQAPCIVWVDEAEKSLAGSASSANTDSGTTGRMIGILSTWIQETRSKICWAMTANSLRNLPTEFVNRMDERFFFDLPNEEERVDILKIHIKGAGQSPERFNLAKLSEDAENMVGREIEQAIVAAMTDSYHANPAAGLDTEILSSTLKKKPRIFKTIGDELKEILDWVGYDAAIDDGVRARFASDKRGAAFRK
jgi:SpoVK/Ycf46/Vps4 family AAA+-type ATPase